MFDTLLTSRLFFPPTVRVRHVLKDGERIMVEKPEVEQLFGTLPARTARIVEATCRMLHVGFLHVGGMPTLSLPCTGWIVKAHVLHSILHSV